MNQSSESGEIEEKVGVVPFAPSKRLRESKPKSKRREVNLGELKKVLEESLDNTQKQEEKPQNNNGVIKPGESIKF